MKMNMINFEKETTTPIYEQVYHKLLDDILQGYLKKGDQLPSIRKAVSLFKVSKTSIERAYEMLLLDGWITSLPQKGYFVDVDENHVSLRKHVLYQPKLYKQEVIRYDFRSQSMDATSFDISLWKRYIKDVLDHHQEITTYGDAQGEKILRMALANYAYSMRGVLCQEDQIIIGSSFQSLLYILFGLFDQNIVVGMEKEGFLPCISVCEDYHIPIRMISQDYEGICMEELYKSDVNVLYINSVTGGKNRQPITKQKRKELLTWAKSQHAWIIEDDHNGELRYHSKMTPAIQGFDGDNHVIYIGSFSKLLLPSLRISYMVLHTELLDRYMQRLATYSPTSSKIEQLALAHYITDGHLERHVKRLKKRYEIKSTRMRTCLHTYFKDAHILLEEAALQFIIRFSTPCDMDSLIKKAESKQIRLSKTDHNELVLSFAAIQEEEIETAMKCLYNLYEEVVEKK